MAFDPNNPTHITELNTELTTDPIAMGYNAAGDDAGDSDKINDVALRQTKANPALADQDNFITAIDLQEAIVGAEWNADLSGNANEHLRRLWHCILESVISAGTINANATNLKNQITTIFSAASSPTTRSNLAALQTRPGSRAEELWGINSFVSVTAIAIALGRP